jgi:hypothetical protein
MYQLRTNPASNYLEHPSDRERAPGKDQSQSMKHGMTLFAHGAEITANTAKSCHSRFTAKGPGNLLLHFGYAKIRFGLVIHAIRH